MLISCVKAASLSYVRLIHNTQNVLTTLPGIFNEKHLIDKWVLFYARNILRFVI